ncbi:MAG: membrane protein insertion efficiency factor YidD [Patescibacteria group bacterium]
MAKIRENFIKLAKNCLILAINLYQVILSPDHSWIRFLNSRLGCKFYPSCSEYTKQSIIKHGSKKGLKYGVLRIVRCHPWSDGGYDPIK